MEILLNSGHILVIMAAVVGLFMAWGIGANDVANAMGTSVGAKALTIKQAIIIAMIFEFAGAYLAGGEVTSTIRKGIIDASFFIDSPELLVFGMISALFAAATWLLIASALGWPVSTTHSIVGAIVGFAAVGVSPEAVEWSKVTGIVGSWVITPLISGVIAFIIFNSAQKLIFDTEKPLQQAKRWVPFYMFLVGFVLALVTIKKGLKHINLHIDNADGFIYATITAVIVAIIGKVFISRLKFDESAALKTHYANVEKVFAVLMIVTACCMAFAHGSNDVANAIGPLAAVVSIVDNGGQIAAKSTIAWWILPLGGFGIVAGLAIFGHKVMATIGQGITHLTPSRGFAAELAAACTVVIASGAGLPISNHTNLSWCRVGCRYGSWYCCY